MEFYGLSEAARRIGVSPAALKWAILYGHAGDVDCRAPNGARLFTPADISRLKTLLNPDRTPVGRDFSKKGGQHD